MISLRARSQEWRDEGERIQRAHRHLRKLIGMGFVTEKRYGAMRMIKSTFTSFKIHFKRGLNVKIEKV